MKANEAPKKIYIDANEDWHRTYTAFTEKAKGNDIEYIRIDAFIEKTAEWIKNKAENYIVDTPLCCYFDYKRAVEQFINYMKEE